MSGTKNPRRFPNIPLNYPSSSPDKTLRSPHKAKHLAITVETFENGAQRSKSQLT
jgi:hypothetical protein